MANNRTNKTIAGYHLLMILSAVDFSVSAKEDIVIREYLVQEFPIQVPLDDEMVIISGLHPEEWEAHFRKMMDDFYDDATEEERNNLIEFAIKLPKEDDVIPPEENRYLTMLFPPWKPAEA